MATAHLMTIRDDNASALTPTMTKLPIALLVLIITTLLLVAGLYLLRKVRKSRKDQGLPVYNEKPAAKSSNHRRLTIMAPPFDTTSQPVYVYQENQNLIGKSSSQPASPIPQIHITFPEEVDGSGKRQSGRIVVVRLGEQSLGLEPLHDEDLPPYQQSSSDRFQSLDLDRIGGLKEKEQRWS